MQIGPTLRVDIGLRSRSAPGQPPDLAHKGVKALIDTGAGGDCIDDDLARSIGLPITNEGEISGVGGRHMANTYTARLFVPALGLLLFQPFTGVKLSDGGQLHRIILGRTFLRPFKMTYNGSDGSVTIDPAPE